MFKKRFALKLISCIVLVCLLVGFTVYAFGAGSSAGTSSDPLVTLSYVNETFRSELLAEVQKRIETATSTVDRDISSLASSFTSELGKSSGSAVESAYSTVTVAAGGVLDVTAGSEFLVLSGSGKLTQNMLIDATAGKSLASGDAIAENHFFTCPASCQLTAVSDLKILVK